MELAGFCLVRVGEKDVAYGSKCAWETERERGHKGRWKSAAVVEVVLVLYIFHLLSSAVKALKV